MAILTAEKIENISLAIASDGLFEGIVTPYHNVCVVLDRLAKSMPYGEFCQLAWYAMTATNKTNRYADIKEEIRRFYAGESFTVQGITAIVSSKVCLSMFAMSEGKNI